MDYEENRARTREEYDEAVAFCVWLRARATEALERGDAMRCARLAVAANVIAKSTRDIEVGDRITRTDRRGEVESMFIVAEVLSRRGKVRRVRADDGDELALYVNDNGSVREHSPDPWTVWRYRREEPGDADVLERERCINTLLRLADAGTRAVGGFRDWPIEDVLRVLAAWPEEKK